MTFIQKINNFIKKKYSILSSINARSLRVEKFNPFFLISFLIGFTFIFFVSSNLIHKKNDKNISNLKEVTKNNEFSNFTSFLISKINSPYEEINYVIKNNRRYGSDNSRPFVLEPEKAVNVDTKIDFLIAEALLLGKEL